MKPLLVALALAATPTAAEDFSKRFETIKREASPEELYRVLYRVPKGGDLHNHLGGAAYDDMLWRLANDETVNGGQSFHTRVRVNTCEQACPQELIYFHTIGEASWQGLDDCCRGEYEPLAELSENKRLGWLSSTRIDGSDEGRNEFFETIWPRVGDVLDQAHILSEMAVENMKLFAAEGVRYVEFQISPWNRRVGERAITDDEFHDIITARVQREDAKATGVTVRFQPNVLRFAPRAEEMVEKGFAFVDRHRDYWSSVNLVGREDNDKGYPLRFLDTFRKMRRRYPRIPLAIHGGEVDEPNHHVRDTLLLGADRIGHGTNLITDPETLLLMRTGKFAIEVSLVSNLLLQYVAHANEHPFAEYLRLGIPVALATDDRGMWNSNMTDEYFLAVTAFNLSWGEVVALGKYSLEFAFVPEDVKAELIHSYERDIQRFVEEYSDGDLEEHSQDSAVSISGFARSHILQ